jgi:hypothetical protein
MPDFYACRGIYNFTPIRNFGAFLALPRQKPGFPLQSFLRRGRKKGFPLQSLAQGRQTVLRYQHGASPTACLYGLKENCDQPGCMGEQRFCFAKS